MAEQYTPTAGEVVNQFAGVNAATSAAIAALLADTPGFTAMSDWTPGTTTTATMVSIADSVETIKPADLPPSAQIVQIFGDTTIDGAFDAGSAVKVLQLASSDNKVSFASDDNITVILQGGSGNEVTTAGGDDLINFLPPAGRAAGAPSATIVTGSGEDTVYLSGTGEATKLDMGEDNDAVIWDGNLGLTASVDGGDGFDTLVVNNQSRGAADLLSNSKTAVEVGNLNLTNMEMVVYNNGDWVIDNRDDVTVIAQNGGETMIARLYQIVYGRQPIDKTASVDNASAAFDTSMKFWSDYAKEHNATDPTSQAGKDMAYAFMNQPEFISAANHGQGYGDPNAAGFDAENYVNQLFAHFNEMVSGKDVTSVNGMTAQQYIDAIQSGDLHPFEVGYMMAVNADAEAVMGAEGAQYVIEIDGGQA